MESEKISKLIQFVPLDSSYPKFFGFSEFIAGLALMVLAWTIADIRYRFRINAAPFPLRIITFYVVAVIGVLTLLSDLWRAEGWLVPDGYILTQGIWQAILGGIFLLTFLTWTWYAFIYPTVFGKKNAKHYAHSLYAVILKGSPTELSVIADEFARSAKVLIGYAPLKKEFRESTQNKMTEVEAYANDIILLIADKRFCRAIVETAPGTALAIFEKIGETKKFSIPIGIFAKNIVNEALSNKDSFLYHEADGYKTGLIGYHKPLSKAMFANYRMVEEIGTLLDLRFSEMQKFDADQLETYCRIVLMTFKDYVDNNTLKHSGVLYTAINNIQYSLMDLYKINGNPDTIYSNDAIDKLRVVVVFIKDAVKILDKSSLPIPPRNKFFTKTDLWRNTFHAYLASMIFKIITSASDVRSTSWLCWHLQHNSIYYELLSSSKLDGQAGNLIKYNVRRLLYDEIVRMKPFPDYLGAKVLRFCLNVSGFNVRNRKFDRDSWALNTVVLSWTKKNFAWLHATNPRIAYECLVEGITYEAEKLRFARTNLGGDVTYFEVDPPPSINETLKTSNA